MQPPWVGAPRRYLPARAAAVISFVSCCLLFALASALSAPAAVAQAGEYLIGRVVDDATGDPVPFVELALLTEAGVSLATARSDVDGRFMLRAPTRSSAVVRARRIGYEPMMGIIEAFSTGEHRTAEVRLIRRAEELSTTTTTARSRHFMLDGFEQRRRLGVGTFFTRDELEQRGWPSIPNLLRGVAGINVTGNERRARVSMARSAQARRCLPVLFVDGVRLNSSDDPPDVVRGIYELVPGSDLTAVEIYKGRSELPAEAGGPEVGCGAIMAWTKRPSEETRLLRPR